MNAAALAKREVIAIDGPPASGKTTVGRTVAQRLGYRFLDTGILYRAVTWRALQQNIPLEEEALAAFAQGLKLQLEPMKSTGRAWRVHVDGEDATPWLRSAAVEAAVSAVAASPGVRARLLGLQREMAEGGAIVVAGQDIGSTVLPKAKVKVFLQASFAERARRRARGRPTAQERLARRSAADESRPASPLAPADDAVVVDTEGQTVEQVVAQVLRLVEGGA